MRLSYIWCHRIYTIERTAFQTNLERKTVIRWWKRFRRVCIQYFTVNPIRLGGPGLEVEIDESFLTTRKAQRGRRVRHHGRWLFRGTERGSNHSFYVLVRRRRAVDLLPHIQHHIRPVL
jgi:hypothetical protein